MRIFSREPYPTILPPYPVSPLTIFELKTAFSTVTETTGKWSLTCVGETNNAKKWFSVTCGMQMKMENELKWNFFQKVSRNPAPSWILNGLIQRSSHSRVPAHCWQKCLEELQNPHYLLQLKNKWKHKNISSSLLGWKHSVKAAQVRIQMPKNLTLWTYLHKQFTKTGLWTKQHKAMLGLPKQWKCKLKSFNMDHI